MTKLPLFALSAVLGVGAISSQAFAHAPPHGLQIVWPPNASASPYVLSNRGLVLPNVNNQDGPDSVYSLRCNEAYGASTSDTPFVFVDDQQALVLQTTEGFSSSKDRGCTWQDGAGLNGDPLGGFYQVKSQPNKLVMTTLDYEMPGLIYQSEDYGRSWTQIGMNASYAIYEVLLASDDGQTVYAAGHRYDQAKKGTVSTWSISTDGSKTWSTVDLDNDRIPLGVLPGNPKVVFARVPNPDPVGDPVDTLVRSDDGGKTFTDVQMVPTITSFLAKDDGSKIWIGSLTGGLFASTDGGHTFQRLDEANVNGITCLNYHEGQLWVCANFAPNTNGIWYSRDDGNTFTMSLDFTRVTARVTCGPDGDASADAGNYAEYICHQPWLDWQYEQMFDFTVDAGVPLLDGSAPIADDASAKDSGTHTDDDKDAGAKDAAVHRDASEPSPHHKHDGGCSALATTGRSGLAGWLLVAVSALLMRRKRSQS